MYIAAKFKEPNFKNILKTRPNCYNNPSYIVYFALMIVPTFFTKYQTIIKTQQIKLRLNLLLPFIGRFTSQKIQLQIFHKWTIREISARYHYIYYTT